MRVVPVRMPGEWRAALPAQPAARLLPAAALLSTAPTSPRLGLSMCKHHPRRQTDHHTNDVVEACWGLEQQHA